MTFRTFMDVALTEARAAATRGEVPVGAVIVNADGVILAQAGNRTRELNDPSAHAEMLVIREACAKLGVERLEKRRPLCHAGTLCDVCGRHFGRARAPSVLRRL